MFHPLPGYRWWETLQFGQWAGQRARRRRTLAWRLAFVVPLLVCLLATWLIPPATAPWQTASGMVLLLLVMTVSVTDVLWHKIPNWATYAAVAWAVAINFYASVAADFETRNALGTVGLEDCLLGATLVFFPMLVVFSLTGGGAGDVKLGAAIGALLGLSRAVDAMLLSFILAGGFALFRAIWQQGPWGILQAVFRSLGNLVCPLWILPPTAEQREFMKQPLPLGPWFAVGTALVLFNFNALDVLTRLGFHLGLT